MESAQNILLVEDEMILALLEKKWLNQEGFNVIHANSGEKAIETVQTGTNHIDLILMDIDLGRGVMDGTQAASTILKNHDIPLLFLSSHTEKEIVEKTEQITSYGYVVKGSTNTVLLASIKMAFKLHKAYRDIKIHEKSLKDREFWLNQSQQVAKIGSYLLDFGSDTWSSSKVLDEIFGIDNSYPRSIEGWLKLVHADDRKMMQTYLENILREGAFFDKEYRITRARDGQVFWVHGLGRIDYDGQNQPVSMTGTIQEITERKHTNEALIKSEESLSITLHSIGDGVIATDSRGLVVRMNPSAEILCGWPFHEAQGKPLIDIFHIVNAETREKVADPVAKVLATGEVIGLANHTVLISRNGTEYQIADSAAPIFDKQGKNMGVVLVFSDVTKQYKIQADLKRSEEQFRLLVSKMEQGLALHEIILNNDGTPVDYRFLEVNDSFERLTGLRREAIIGKTVLEILPETENYWIERYGQVALTGQPVYFEDYSKELGKYYETYTYSPRLMQFAVILSDITKRKVETEEIKLNEQRLNCLVNVLQYQVDSIQEYLDFALAEALKLTGSKIGYIYHYNEESQEFTLNSWSPDVMPRCNVMNPQTVYKLENTGFWGEAVRQGKPIFINDFQAPHQLKKGYPEGHVPVVKFLTIPILNNAKIAGVVGVANKEADYTQTDVLNLTVLMDSVWQVIERKNAEWALQASEKSLKEVQLKKDKLLSILAHDLRSPFLGVLGLSEEMANNENTLEREEISNYAAVLHSTAKKTYELLTNLLDWASLQTGKYIFNPVLLNLFIKAENIKSLFASSALNKSITIYNEVNQDTSVFADNNMVSVVLSNLVSNAIKFTHQDGKIVIGAELKGDFVEVSITDTGMGMNEETINKVMINDAGFTSRGTAGEPGTGLGLVLCKELVEKNGGEIIVTSIPGKGTTFTFSLPAHPL